MKTLVAIDGSDASLAALASACRIAAKTRAYVTAFYVNKGAEYSAEQTGWLQLKEKIETELEERGGQIIRRAVEIGRGLGVEVEGIMAYGLPAEEVARYVGAHGIVNLIALGHSSKGWGTQGFVGSTTRMVLSLVERASLLITSREDEITTILVAVDDTGAAARTAGVAGRLAQSLGAEVRLASVVPDMDAIRDEYRQIAEVPNLDKYIHESRATLEAKAHRAVERAEALLRPLGVKVSVAVRQGSPVKELLALSRDAGLTAVGLKSRPEPRRIGRTVGRLLQHPEVSLLCVQ